MKVINQGASATFDLNLKKGKRFIDFSKVTDLTVALLCDNMNVRTELTPGEHFRVSGDRLTVLLDKTLTVRVGKYKVLVRGKYEGQWIAFDPYAFVIVRTPAPSVYEATRYGMTGHFEISVAFGDSAGEEADPVFQNSPAGNIRQEDIDEWNTPPSTLSDAEIDAICK